MGRWRSPAARKLAYDKAAQEYLRNLPLEHFMESVDQANQRKISLACLGLIAAKRTDMHVHNELLVQYPKEDETIGQVVPDNMVVVYQGTIRARGSFDVPDQPVGPFWVLEYVSRNSERKDYEANFFKYEQGLQVPYYLIFHPEEQELTLFRLRRKKYVSVKPNKQGRLPIKELEIEVAILGGWVRFWYQGNLVPLPEDLQRQLEETSQRLTTTEQKLTTTEQKLTTTEQKLTTTEQKLGETQQERDDARRRASEAEEALARLQAELERLRKSSSGG